jgi:hypothetical protein
MGKLDRSTFVIARSASDEAIHVTDFAAPWIASLRSQ